MEGIEPLIHRPRVYSPLRFPDRIHAAKLERRGGLEPTTSRWKAAALPIELTSLVVNQLLTIWYLYQLRYQKRLDAGTSLINLRVESNHLRPVCAVSGCKSDLFPRSSRPIGGTQCNRLIKDADSFESAWHFQDRLPFCAIQNLITAYPACVAQLRACRKLYVTNGELSSHAA